MKKMLSLLLLLLATMTSWTSAYAQTNEEYDAALAAITDGGVYYVKASGYYLKGDGTLTTSKPEATPYIFQKAPGSFKPYGFKLNNNGNFFSNPPGTSESNLANGRINTSTRGDNEWEAQVFFLKDGKYAVRAGNPGAAESGWAWVAGSYWTVVADVDPAVAQYQWEPNYIWELEFDQVATQQVAAYNTVQNWLTKIQTASGLVKDASKFYSNAKEPSEGSYEALLDGTYETFFHSSWSVSVEGTHYLQAELSAPTQKFQFYFKKRSQNNNNRPTTIVISASNDGENFTEIQTINEGLPTSDAVIDSLSDVIDLGAAYKYVRFTIPETNNGQKKGDHVFFTFSEFYLLPNNPTFEAALDYWKQGKSAFSLTENDIAAINQIEYDLNNALVDVTYQVKFNDAIVATATAQVEPNSAPSLPESLKRDFVTFSDPDINVITKTDNVVTYTATWDESIFKISTDYENAQWQNMSMRGTWYVTTDQKGDNGAYKTVNANAVGLGTDAYQWAFVGNPWQGFKVLNKAEGAGKSFGVTEDQKANAGIPTFMSEEVGEHLWRIGKSTSGVGKFFLNVPGTNLYINQYGGAGGLVQFWNSTNNVGDPGSSFTVFDVPTDFSEFVNSEIAPYVESTAKYFVLSDAAKAEIGYDPAYKEDCPFDAYKTMKDKLTEEFLANPANYVLPETGYYLLQNKMYGTYMGIDPTDANLYGNYKTANAAKQIVKLTKVGDKTYNISLMGKFAPASVVISQPVTASVDAGTYTLVIPTLGYGAFQADTEQAYSCLHCRAEGDIVGWEAPADASLWTAIDASSILFEVGEEGYATAYMPFPFENGGALADELPTPVGAWTFDDPANPLAGTGTATLVAANHSTDGSKWLETKENIDAAGITTIDGGLYLPKGSSLLMNTNNGAESLDKYTVMFDICSDDMSGYTPLWQNSLTDDKDGSLFIKNGQIGLGGSLGYNGDFKAGEWYRVVLVIDTPNKAALYVDGEMISSCEHTDSYNRHWMLPEPGAVFFADEDGEEKDIKVTGLRFWDVPFNATQVAQLGTVAGEKSIIAVVPEATGAWTFDNGTMEGTGIATLTASNGVVANEDGSITLPVTERLEMTSNLAEESLETYTLMMDVKLSDISSYTTFFTTDLTNENDACWFNRNGSIGTGYGSLGYHGSIEAEKWYRLVFVVDGLRATEYIDGVVLAKSGSTYDGWRMGTGLLFFEDNDGEKKEISTTEIRFWNQALTAEQVAALATVGTEPNLKAYTATIGSNGNDKWLTLNEVKGAVPEATPVIIKAVPNTYILNIKAEVEDEVDGLKIHKDTAVDGGEALAKEVVEPAENVLKGTFEPIAAAGKYVLAKPEGEIVGFYKAASGNIAPGKAYLEVDADVKAFYFGGDEQTGIKAVDTAKDNVPSNDNAIYNLSGQRVSKAMKGIYIVNGKKILK